MRVVPARAVASARADPVQALALLAANSVPLVGVLLFDWSVALVMVVYWLENAVIGLLNVPKLVLCRHGRIDAPGEEAPGLFAAVVVGFFLVHYGIFWIGHGWFIDLLFVPDREAVLLAGAAVGLAVAALSVEHLVSSYRDFYRTERYRERYLGQQMLAPYRRVLALHLTLIFAAGFVLLTPVVGVVFLVAFKTLFDLGLWWGTSGTDAGSGFLAWE